MAAQRPFRGSEALAGLSLLGLAYVGALYYLRTLTGLDVADGVIGVLLGLYIASHPAANAIDMLFFRRHVARELLAGTAGAIWLALNALALAVGWVNIWVGAVRFVPPAP
ncbi:MAG: hypothetical protein H5T65_00095 [Chloroflexi bacterium]|nr:hypothetical protein [Chloroflexota bacterium]